MVSVPAVLLAQEVGHEAKLAAERRQECLEIGQPGLHLHDQQRPLLRVKSDDIDGPALPEVVEGVLDKDLPTLDPEPGDHQLDEARVLPIDEAVDVA